MPTQILHLSELGGAQWVLPVYAKANAWHSQHGQPPLPTVVTQLGLHISIRLNLLHWATIRLNGNLKALKSKASAAKLPQHVFFPGKPGVALPIDNELKYLVIADMHLFITELDACIDHLKVFMHEIHAYVGKPIDDAMRIAIINGWMQKRGIDPRWFGRLAHCRNFVAHKGALYLAFDITRPDWDLLLLKENVQIPTPAQCFRLSALVQIHKDFAACKQALQDHLVDLLA
ncbi:MULTISPECIES: hypothetical protein [Cupriavidus]|uniref:Cthe-2314-like HEPN domain-containing protein n=1 Tax=Cupriavidus pauculus TaxID=82633 RepID=A0A5P2H9I2_9BURK|nr:hypothetical protein [Cupriavidus pauculus]QET04368.1 hypothetical protein FOB72_19710 [Cupriavidus pauculus]